MKRLLVCSLALALLTGCAGRFKAGNSFVGNLPKNAGVQKIAEDAVACLVTLYPPGSTTVHLVTPKTRDDFSTMFDTSLRAKGFTLSPSGALTVVYVLDALRADKPLSWYLQLQIADKQGSKTFTRSYTATGQPEAGFSSIATDGGVTED